MRESVRAHAGLLAALVLVLAAAAAIATVAFGASSGSLESKISASQDKEGEVRSGIGADSHQIAGFQGNIDDLQTRLSALETSLTAERNLLASIRSQLSVARTRLAGLQVQLVHDRKVLVEQLIASYEAPPPDIATVILQAHGFADLIERFDDLKAISRENASATTNVLATQKAVTAEAAHLTVLESTHSRETRAVQVQRDEVAELHLAVVKRQLQFVRARDAKSSELEELQSHKHSLEHELAHVQAAELEASGVTYAGPIGEFNGTTEGEYGFFPAAGTNYSVGEEPTLAEHLNTMGKALHLHLIGISGYRSPEHSVEVGGFANDPHTRGEASDTPGVEGVPESTLAQFGLIRPFPGAAEADHIQLLGSKY
ncbi:MAG TPA: D-Ala-D-Ala carboxypeptidase family metallohydrolase [Solirubrobacteraceae bacterium]|nr:D-Ala-D-Ala carboxypeptidase family metallohydrolase [Solirubrobacteraceae bacterium]